MGLGSGLGLFGVRIDMQAVPRTRQTVSRIKVDKQGHAGLLPRTAPNVLSSSDLN